MTPEAKAREKIDQKLAQAGWVVQDLKQLNLGLGLGVAVREYPTDGGPADYVLFVNRLAAGVIEAKRDEAGENLTAHEAQTERYANATLKWRKDQAPLPIRSISAWPTGFGATTLKCPPPSHPSKPTGCVS